MKTEKAMTSFILNITFDCSDPPALARFWGQVTGWPVIEEPRPGHEESAVVPPGEGRPRLYFVKVPEGKDTCVKVGFKLTKAA